MKKLVIKVIALICLFTLFNYAEAQDKFEFRYTQEEQVKVQLPYEVRSHFLGDEIAEKFQLLKESYTTLEINSIAKTENMVVEKSSIFYSCKKVSKYLKQGVKKGEISIDEARKQMSDILTIALNIRYQETSQIEKILWDINKNPEQVLAFYQEKVTLDY